MTFFLVFMLIAIIGIPVLLTIAFFASLLRPLASRNIKCPSCGHNTRFMPTHPKHSRCRMCNTLLVICEDGYIRAHVPPQAQ